MNGGWYIFNGYLFHDIREDFVVIYPSSDYILKNSSVQSRKKADAISRSR